MPAKIAPTKAEPGHPFTIIDTPDGRLADGTKAILKLNGSETEIDLKTKPQGKTANGRVPDGQGGGDYTMCFKLPDGTVIDVGSFEVVAEPTQNTEPSIDPTGGAPGTNFTITDPEARLTGATVVAFFEPGSAPEAGTEATEVSASADGKTVTGKVPNVPTPGPNSVTVHRERKEDPPILAALDFNVFS